MYGVWTLDNVDMDIMYEDDQAHLYPLNNKVELSRIIRKAWLNNTGWYANIMNNM